MSPVGEAVSEVLLSDDKAQGIARILRARLDWRPRNILVVGCGSGIEAAILASELEACVIGVDLQTDFDPRARRTAQLQRGDATQLEFADESFDLVYSYHALEHIADYRRALTEMHRVVRTGGWYCIGTPNRARLIGYVGSCGVGWAKKFAWNLADWRAKLAGRFRNELGAHAGFTAGELGGELKRVFRNAEDITLRYYLQIYPRYGGAIRALARISMGRFCFPSVYFLGQKTSQSSVVHPYVQPRS